MISGSSPLFISETHLSIWTLAQTEQNLLLQDIETWQTCSGLTGQAKVI